MYICLICLLYQVRFSVYLAAYLMDRLLLPACLLPVVHPSIYLFVCHVIYPPVCLCDARQRNLACSGRHHLRCISWQLWHLLATFSAQL